ncbi:MAG: nucleotidyl transferase AbiEii/AbiGii toxin family protein [Desulfobacteraceae bacterium]|nr:nucleotidyl transferase AbiEii/AbiGii toxin family protein [Desulfobacteraceae bacterium]MBC2755500.1 nucleotidyl transferase AbiEii/AbiGii toxin family protein [Desulfobacteraceae bacterium]
MHSAIEQMLDSYHLKTPDDYKHALKEIIQEIALLGLSRSNFFDSAAFYGGTALRIFYGLDRFSEDLDFSLLEKNKGFDISDYCTAIRNELGAYGFDMTVEKKQKKVESNIESAFIKGETLVQLLNINAMTPPISGVHKNEILKIKLEVDVLPPSGAEFEVKYSLRPIPYSIRIFSLSSLFAGKLHAVLCRGWESGRMKGRDLYDMVWYISNATPVNLAHLEERMKQTGHLEDNQALSREMLLNLLKVKFNSMDFKQAKADIIPFINDPAAVAPWSNDFFNSISKRISCVEPGAG